MNYLTIYNDLCSRGQIRLKEPGIFYERHHIIPKCFGGSKKRENMTTLTLREHYIAHLLLTFIYPNSRAMHFALWNMCHVTPDRADYNRYIPSGHTYERIRGEYMLNCTGTNSPRYGISHSVETRDKIREKLTGRKRPDLSIIQKGRKVSEETRVKLRGLRHTPEAIKKISEAAKRPCAEATKRKISASNRGKSSPLHYRVVLQFDLKGNFIKEWDALTIAAEYTGIHYMNITQSCKGKSIRAGAFIWRYKDTYNGEPIVCKRSNQRALLQYDKENNLITTFNTIQDAAAMLNIKLRTLQASARLGYCTNGFYFKYLN